MEKHYRNEDGAELIARNEIQAAAFENEGFKAAKTPKKAAADTEFAQDVDLGAASTQANAVPTANAMNSSAHDTEFAAESNMGASALTNAALENAYANASSGANNMNTEFAAEADLGSLKAQADSLGVTYAKNIGAEALAKKIANAQENNQ